jgi:ATP-dependent protease HslVU (ClpYQ) peptidase subunit
MTTIVAVQHEDKVTFGADNQVTGGNGRMYRHIQMAKISKVGEYIIAGAGEVAACDIAQHLWTPPVPTAQDKKDLYHFMIAKVMPSLKEAFKQHEYKWNEIEEDDGVKFSFLIAVGGEVFDIGDDLSVIMDARGFYGVGSGANYAIGALASGKTIKEALTIASDYDAYTSGPFLYFTQEKIKKVASKSKS